WELRGGSAPGKYSDRCRFARRTASSQNSQAYRPYMRIDAEAAFSPPRPTPPEAPEEITADRR
ncbi:hypothetical protein KI387_040797, partial [Taxus chinensis]